MARHADRRARMDYEGVVNDIDPVVRALLAAIAVLEDLGELYSHEHMPRTRWSRSRVTSAR
jgi:hypothetical protein